MRVCVDVCLRERGRNSRKETLAIEGIWTLFGESYVQHILKSFCCKMVGVFGNTVLIQHPEVIKELETATAHTPN